MTGPWTGQGKPRQIALDLGHGTARSRDDLLVTPANAEAVAAVDRWPDWTAPFLVIAGPPGSGRTHLASAWAERSGARFLAPGTLREADGGSATQPLVIDDVDSGPMDETGLFHLLNAARAAENSVLMTAHGLPAAWGVRLPDLASRLKLAAVAPLHVPDDALLSGVVTKLFADRQVAIDASVVAFLIRRIERSLAAAARAVDALDRAAMENKTRITRAFAATVLAQPGGSGERTGEHGA